MFSKKIKKHRGKSERTPRKLKKKLAKQGLVEVWFDFDQETLRRLEILAIARGLPNPGSKETLGKVAVDIMMEVVERQNNGSALVSVQQGIESASM